MPRRRLLAATAPLLAWCIALGCKGPAYGSDNAIIAVVHPELREAVEPILRQSFERTVLTTRSEPVFEVTFASTEAIGEFRRWKRIVVVEPADGEANLVPDLLGGDELEAARDDGVLAEVDDKWARDQTIWVVAAPTAEATIALVRSEVDSLYRVIHDRFAAAEIERMWASEPDSSLAERLLDSLGFALVLPRVYTPAPASAPPATMTFYNEDPRRIVSIHWTERPVVVDVDTVLAIRRAWGEQIFPDDSIPARIPAAADTAGAVDATAAAPDTAGTGIATAADTAAAALPPTPLLVSQTSLGGRPAVRLQGVWQNPRDHTAGVFITYGVTCGDRLVLLDANIFAPDRPKYPYVLQMERIFETFRCPREGRG